MNINNRKNVGLAIISTLGLSILFLGAIFFVACKKNTNPSGPEPKPTSIYTRTITNTSTPTSVPTNTVIPTATPSITPSAGFAVVNLGTAGDFAILSKAGISTTGATSITGDLGVSPIDATAITGFALVVDASNTFATSSLVTGKVYAADYTPPTPAKMTAAVSDMEIAFTDAAGRTGPTATELGAGDISGMTINPGLYKWGTGVLVNSALTLDCLGDANGVYIFQIGIDLTIGSGTMVTLSGGCQAQNIFWQVYGPVVLGTTSNFKGIILSQTSIDVQTGAVLNGRALAQTAVTLDANNITECN